MNASRAKRAAAASRRRALTLIELVVVVAILVALSGLVVPLIQGLGYQTNAAINATVVDDVNRSINSFYARTGNHPDGWDSLLSTAGARFTQLHPAMLSTATPSLLQDSTINQIQVDSLNSIGIYNVRDADESSTLSPNQNNGTVRRLIDGGQVVKLSTLGITTLGGEFQVNQSNATVPLVYEFVVFGLGSGTTVQGATMMQVPLIQSADPSHHYARPCCVYMIPPADATTATSFPAKYIGCIMPDGTTSRKNIENYNNNAATN